MEQSIGSEIPIDFLSVKIKQEKIEEDTPKNKNKEVAADSSVSDNIDSLLGTYINPTTKTDTEAAASDEKKSIEPIKSSNEILAELFSVFNSAPPSDLSLLLADTTAAADDTKKSKKSKKHKKDKKHKKKHKRKGRSSSDEDSDSAEVAVKSKKVKREHDKSEEKQKPNVGVEIKKEKTEKSKSSKRNRDEDESRKKHKKRKKEKSTELKVAAEDLDIAEYEKNLLQNEKISASTKEKATSGKTGKIVIKSLKHSSVYKETVKEVEAREKKKEREYLERYDEGELSDSKSSLSLSDEETYQRNKERRADKDSYYASSDRDHHSSHRRDADYSREDGRSYGRSNYDSRYENSRDRDRRYNDYRSRNRRISRSRSRSRRRDNSEERIDKKRLLEIARKNAISMLKNGTLPGTQNLAQEAKEKVLAKMRYGGKSVDELTDFCKKLSNGEANGYLSNVSDDSDHDKDGNEKAFNHPFVLQDRGPIVMNIRNAIPIQPKTAEQTKAILMQFPVSSGQHHRLNESEWVPVPPPKKPAPVPPPAVVKVPKPPKIDKAEKTIIPAIMPAPPPQPPPPPPPPQTPAVIPEPPVIPETSIFADNSGQNLDVTSIITKRLNAMRKLQDNPLDSEALKLMYNTQKDMSAWANSKFVPGQFTGSTGANILSARELTSGFQAWAKRDQLISTAPVSGGMGMHLLQKMGWRPGEGLGKEKNGSLQPLLLEVKLDKKGLLAIEENPNAPRKRKPPPANLNQAQQSLESKHPVSLLGEFAAKRKWQMPIYDTVSDTGPQHSKKFLFTVQMNGMTYTPPKPSNTKKEAKANAAKFALKKMGVIA